MARLSVEQKTILALFSADDTMFLIPDYQRPYAWGDSECETLWDDIFNFAIPDNDFAKFDNSSEYFLGPIVTFINDDKQKEIIDGQQRLTTLLLLLRAFYENFGSMQDENSIETRKLIEGCIWKTNEFGKADKNTLKIESEVASDNDRTELIEILRSGVADKGYTSCYARNYNFFIHKITEFKADFPTYYPYLAIRILKNCILLPIEAESQDTALRIFSTLNDRGMPLSDSDIFKAQFYKFFASLGQKDEFITRWKRLESITADTFSPISGSPMDDLFTRYMYYLRAKAGNKSSSVEALRKFYEKNSYAILKSEECFSDLEELALFWLDVSKQNADRFSERILRLLFILNYAPNSMWTYFVSVYFMANRDDEGYLDDTQFYHFLERSIAFIWTYSFESPGVNALRTPIFAEMINIVNHREVTFNERKFKRDTIKDILLDQFLFTNSRPITKSMLAWWSFKEAEQPLLPLETKLDIEHIYPKKRQENENGLSDSAYLDYIGNKSLLEKRINIRAADYKFGDKKKYYEGFTSASGSKKDGTKIHDLLKLSSTKQDFTEEDILQRDETILLAFIDYVAKQGLFIAGKRKN